MKNRYLLPLLSILLMVSLGACDKEENDTPKRLKLEAIGFSGILPDGRTFCQTGIVASNWVGGSAGSADGSYILHGLTVTDTLTKISIHMDLPLVKYSNDYIAGSEGDGSELKRIARQYYPYQTVKEKLSVGNKILVSSQIPNFDTNSFRVQVVDNANYNDFLCVEDQTGSYLKVTELIESTETDPVSGNVKTLKVTFDLDVKMVHARGPGPTLPTNLKGLLRMKYRQI